MKTSKVGSTSKEESEEVFNWIEKSQRYSFNKSHAVSYAMNCYLSAYARLIIDILFYVILRILKDKIDPQQETKELVQNANEMGISVVIQILGCKMIYRIRSK